MRSVISVLVMMIAGSASPALGQDTPSPIPPRDPTNARGTALGGTRAVQIGTGAIAHNAAALGLTRSYQMEGYGLYDPESTAVTLGSAIADSFSNRIGIGLGLGYAYTFTDEDHGDVTGHDLRVAFALPLGSTAAIGLTGRYLTVDARMSQGGEPPAEVELVDALTLDASFALRLGQRVWLSAIGENLTDTGSAWAPLRLGAAAGILPIDILSLSVDVAFDLTTYDGPRGRYLGSAELLAASRFPLRVGYGYDDGRGVHTVSGGVGYVDQKFGLDLSLRQDVSGESDTLIAAGFRIFIR